MKIFMTGATGFMGGELLKELHARGHEMTALVRDPKKATDFPANVNWPQERSRISTSYRKLCRATMRLSTWRRS